MSWNFSLTDTGKNIMQHYHNEDELKSLESMNKGSTGPAVLALECVKDVLQEEVLGSLDKTYFVHCNGHVNPDHEPQSRFVNDYISIQISQRPSDLVPV
jgi:hypothetical protein